MNLLSKVKNSRTSLETKLSVTMILPPETSLGALVILKRYV